MIKRAGLNLRVIRLITFFFLIGSSLFLSSCENSEVNYDDFIDENIKAYSLIKYRDSLYYKEINGLIYKKKFLSILDSLVLDEGRILYSIEVDHSYTNNNRGKRKFLFSNSQAKSVSFIYDIDYKFIKESPAFCEGQSGGTIHDFINSLGLFDEINNFLTVNRINNEKVIKNVLSFVFGEQLSSLNRNIEELNTKSVNRSIDLPKETNKKWLIGDRLSCCLEALRNSDKLEKLENKLLFPTNLFGVVSCDINPKKESNKVVFGYHYFECNIPLY
jgi:hypothetical protein